MIALAHVERAVCLYFNTTREVLVGTSRKRPDVWHRQVAMAVGTRVGHSTTKVGHWFGGRDHATVLYATRAVDEEPDLARWRDIIIDALTMDWITAVPFRTRRKT